MRCYGYWLISDASVASAFPFHTVLNCSGIACSLWKGWRRGREGGRGGGGREGGREGWRRGGREKGGREELRNEERREQ